MPGLQMAVPKLAVLIALLVVACGGDSIGVPPTPPPVVTASVYILPDAPALGAHAFGDPPLVIFKGERMRWVNLDASAHVLVADTRGVPDFTGTRELPPGGEQSFIMTTTGTTAFHCAIHPGMVGTLVVRDR
jgi:hypothetical protein